MEKEQDIVELVKATATGSIAIEIARIKAETEVKLNELRNKSEIEKAATEKAGKIGAAFWGLITSVVPVITDIIKLDLARIEKFDESRAKVEMEREKIRQMELELKMKELNANKT